MEMVTLMMKEHPVYKNTENIIFYWQLHWHNII